MPQTEEIGWVVPVTLKVAKSTPEGRNLLM